MLAIACKYTWHFNIGGDGGGDGGDGGDDGGGNDGVMVITMMTQ